MGGVYGGLKGRLIIEVDAFCNVITKGMYSKLHFHSTSLYQTLWATATLNPHLLLPQTPNSVAATGRLFIFFKHKMQLIKLICSSKISKGAKKVGFAIGFFAL